MSAGSSSAKSSGKAEATAGANDAVEFAAGRVGAVFAAALLGAGQGQADALVAELDTFIDEVIVKQPQFESLLGSGMIPPEEKVAIVDRVLKGRLSPTLLNFLKVLVEHGRGDVLRSVQRAAHTLLDERHRRVRVRVTTATAIDEAAAGKIVEAIRRATGSEPVLERVVDTQVIGGAVFRIGDTIYDGSIATQLERMRTQLLNRSVHEIQSRRDRFGNSEGN